jgi:hypothetical protein
MGRGQSSAGPAKASTMATSNSQNTVRFQKMSQRVKRARTAATLAPRGANIYDQGDAAMPQSDLIADFDVQGACGTFFRDTLSHWSDRNLTSQFVRFQRQVHAKVQTLPLLLHHLKDVVDACLQHLVEKEARRPILALIAAIAQDVGKDMLPHMEHVVRTMLDCVDPADPEFMGSTVTALSLLFKHLAKHLLGELGNVCNWCSPLLTHRKQYVREFAAESLAFLLRKLKGKQLRKMVRGIVMSTDASVNDEDHHTIDGVAILLFEVVKNVQNQFHSQAENVLRAMFSCLGASTGGGGGGGGEGEGGRVSDVRDVKGKIVLQGLYRMMEHTRATHANVVWKELFRAVHKYSAVAETSGASSSAAAVAAAVAKSARMEGLSSTLR